jgi:hypothetical protein
MPKSNYDIFKERYLKNLLNTQAFKSLRFPVNKALLLPGEALNCLKLGYVTGKFNSNTEFIFVERDPDICEQIYMLANCMDLNYTLYEEELTEMDPAKYPVMEDLDFIYADICGCLTWDKLKWVKSLKENLKNFDFWITLASIKHPLHPSMNTHKQANPDYSLSLVDFKTDVDKANLSGEGTPLERIECWLIANILELKGRSHNYKESNSMAMHFLTFNYVYEYSRSEIFKQIWPDLIPEKPTYLQVEEMNNSNATPKQKFLYHNTYGD